jgi:integrase
MQIFDVHGQRLYLTAHERSGFLKAALKAEKNVQAFCMVLAYTGARISEVLALTPKRIDINAKVIIIETLKKRRSGIYRTVPVPDHLLNALDKTFGLKELRSRPELLNEPIWPWCRMTAYRKVLEIMDNALISDGPHKCPKGLRHAFGVLAISKGISLNMVSKWMGHASLDVTAIYTNAIGEEQRALARKMW